MRNDVIPQQEILQIFPAIYFSVEKLGNYCENSWEITKTILEKFLIFIYSNYHAGEFQRSRNLPRDTLSKFERYREIPYISYSLLIIQEVQHSRTVIARYQSVM